MKEFLYWLVTSLAGLLAVAVSVATWEYLRQQTLAEPHPRLPIAPGTAMTLEVDVEVPLAALANPADSAAEPPASQRLMSQALNRASSQARQGREGSPWLDTQPRVTQGLVEPAQESAPMLSLSLSPEPGHSAVPEAVSRPLVAEAAVRPPPIFQAQAEPAERAAVR